MEKIAGASWATRMINETKPGLLGRNCYRTKIRRIMRKCTLQRVIWCTIEPDVTWLRVLCKSRWIPVQFVGQDKLRRVQQLVRSCTVFCVFRFVVERPQRSYTFTLCRNKTIFKKPKENKTETIILLNIHKKRYGLRMYSSERSQVKYICLLAGGLQWKFKTKSGF